MKKTAFRKTRAMIFAIAAIVCLVIGIYGMTRPMSYGSVYYHASSYEGEDFSGTMTFYEDNTMVIRNSNFEEDIKSMYYYKEGYLFFVLATTQEKYQEEVAAINADFEAAINTPFYASKINPFVMTSQGLDGYESAYLCQRSVMMAAVWGVVELALIGLAITSALCRKKCAE